MYRPAVRSASKFMSKRSSIPAVVASTRVAHFSNGAAADSFNSGSSSTYIDQMYSAYKADPKSVHASWQAYFLNMDSGLSHEQSFASPPVSGAAPWSFAPSSTTSSSVGGVVNDSLNVFHLINAYQVSGHEMANLDPLGIHAFRQHKENGTPELDRR